MPSKLFKLFSKMPFLRKKERDIESSYYKNLRKLLEDLIASSDSESHPIHCYSVDDIMMATNNFHPSRIVREDSYFSMFKGLINNRPIIIVAYFTGECSPIEDEARSLAIRDIVIATQMSNHENILKLLGCCLGLPVPALVYENAAQGVLDVDGSLRGVNEDQFFLPWKTRLRIAKQLASAVTHLHTAFPRPIIHRNLKPHCIFLDDDYVPKLTNFSLSITIPPMQSHVEDDLKGTFGYLDPVYLRYNHISEKTDVYSFGVILLVFLTGQSAKPITKTERDYESAIAYAKSHASEEQLQTIVDPKIFMEVRGNEQVQQQLYDFLALALFCIQDESEGRPYMIDVARELVRIDESIYPS